MKERSKRRAKYRTWKKGYYHLCTDGKRGILCYDDAEYAHLVNVIAVLDRKFPVKVHFYEVMRSHVHLLLSGRGTDCVDAFDYLKYRASRRLREDGHPSLPKDYDFKLIPIEDEDQMRRNIVYMARNAFEVKDVVPVSVPRTQGSSGCTAEELAAILCSKKVEHAYALAGGLTAELVFDGQVYAPSGDTAEVPVSDILYFATALPYKGVAKK